MGYDPEPMETEIESPLQRALRTPFTLQVAIGATIISVNWWLGGHWAEPLIATDNLFSRPWAMLTCTLPHVNFIHLLFNLSWWWPFGSRIERVWGSGRAAAIFVVLAVISMVAEYAFVSGGVGLSGVVYGQCALLWVVQDKVPGLRNTVTPQVLKLFAGWFLFCIVLTLTQIAPIGNVAHGVGALAGWVLGKLIVSRESRGLWAAMLAVMAVLIGVSATVARPRVNVAWLFEDEAQRGMVALRDGRYDEAVQLLEAAERKSPDDPVVAINLGIAYQYLERHDEALPLYKRAVELDADKRIHVAPMIAEILDRQAYEAGRRGDVEEARARAIESLKWEPNGRYPRELIGILNSGEPLPGDIGMMP